MVKRDTVLVILNGSVHAGCGTKGFLHHRLHTETTSKVCIPANRGKMCWPCSKVVVGNRIEWRGISPHLIIDMARGGTRVERGRAGQGTLARETRVFVGATGLPVDGLHAALKVRRGSKLPLANDGPHDDRGTDRSSDDNNNRHRRV